MKRNAAQSKIPITAIKTPTFLTFSELVNLAQSLASLINSVNSAFYQFLLWDIGVNVTNIMGKMLI